MTDSALQWGFPTERYLCPACDAAFLAPAGAQAGRCPRCFQAGLERLDRSAEAAGFDDAHAPELALDFGLSPAQIEAAVQQFAGGIPYPPEGLNPAAIRQGLRRSYLPMWLVDAQVNAHWKAEAGFNYQVVSHQERYADGGGWATREVTEQRTRWEPRLGRLQRAYSNVAAPALEDHARLKAALGAYDLTAAQPYASSLMQDSLARLPDRSPADAWSEARPALQAAAGEECRQAAQADDLRAFAWQPEFSDQNWTLLLLPVYSAAYLDDDGRPQPVWINAQSGRISGARRASLRRATRSAVTIVAAAALIFILGLLALLAGVVLPPLAALGLIGMTLAVALGVGALFPLVQAWTFNRSQAQLR